MTAWQYRYILVVAVLSAKWGKNARGFWLYVLLVGLIAPFIAHTDGKNASANKAIIAFFGNFG